MRCKIAFLSNIPTPYQFDFWEQVAIDSQVNLIFCEKTEENRHWEFDNSSEHMHIHMLERKYKFLSSLLNSLWITRYIIRDKPSHIVIGGYSKVEFILAAFVAKLLGLSVHFWLERPFTHNQPLWKRILLRALFRNASVFAIGTIAQRFYEMFCTRVFCLPYSVNSSIYEKAPPYQSGSKIKFIYMGQFIDRKNVIGMASQFILACKDPRVSRLVSLTIVGSGPQEQELIDMLTGSGLTNWEIRPFQQREGVIKALAASDVLIIPSQHDGWAVVVNEAVSSGLSVIATENVGAAHDIIAPNRAGFLISNITELAEKIKLYALHHSLLDAHRASALQCAPDFSSARCADLLLKQLLTL